jgi:predicted transcriptional regulator
MPEITKGKDKTQQPKDQNPGEYKKLTTEQLEAKLRIERTPKETLEEFLEKMEYDWRPNT